MIRRLLDMFRRGEADVPAIGDGPIAAPASAGPVFVPCNPLEQALVQAAHYPDWRADFHDLLLESTLFALSPDMPASRGMRLPESVTSLRLAEAPGPDGRPLPILFSAQLRIFEAFGSGVGFFAAEGAKMLRLAEGRGALLNPGLGYSVHWSADDIGRLIGRPSERRSEKGSRVTFSMPNAPPVELVQDLRVALGGDPRIAGAWFATAHWLAHGRLCWYLDIRTTLTRAEIETRLEPIFRHADLGGRPLDMVVNPPDGSEGAGLRIVG